VRLLRARRYRQAAWLQLLFVAVGIGFGLVLPRIHAGARVSTSRAVDVLGVVGFGILGLVTVIYSLLFLVVQSSNSTFTPRLNLFQGDPWIWRTYAAALGLFAYSMSAFLTIGGAEEVSVVVPIFAFVAALVVIGLMRNIQAKAFASLQVNSTLDSLIRAGLDVIDALYPRRLPCPSPEDSPSVLLGGGRRIVWPASQATLQQLDVYRLLASLDKTDVAVVLRVGVGQVLWEGTIVAEVYGDVRDDLVLDSLVTGVNRTYDQDPLLAFRLLSDIGLRALSPAINDPATAVQALEAIVGLLMALAPRDLGPRVMKSSSGRGSVVLDLPDWEDFLAEGLDELLYSSARSPMMLARASEALKRLEEVTPAERKAGVEIRLENVQPLQQSANGN
jgi:uncharacterized membrane protein